MKIFFLILSIQIYTIKCESRTVNINDKSCTTNENDMVTCDTSSSKDKCEQKGCCYNNKSKKKCFKPSCIDGCKKCKNLISCEECEEGYYITEDKTNCYNSLIDFYYINGNTLKKGYQNCLKCNSSEINNVQNELYKSISINMNCITCKDNYYQLNGTNNCYDTSFENEGYYLKDKIYYPCDESCSTCSDKKNGDSNNCRSCDNTNKRLFLVEGLNNCENENYLGYYLDKNAKILKKCYESCKKCKAPFENNDEKQNHNCVECVDNYYKLGENNCFTDEIPIEGYYLNKEENPFLWKECYERCLTCNNSGNLTNMNCLSCKKDLINPKKSKPYNFILTKKGDCIEECPNNSYLTLEGDCVPICPSGSYHFSFNHTCLESCPYNYEIHLEQNKCVIKSFDQTTSSTEFKSQIKENITSYMNNSSIINGSDFIAVFLTTDKMDPEEQIKKGISAIDLGECTQIIKGYYNISKNESLIILNMESKNIESNNEEKNDDKFRKKCSNRNI